jgi:hypothetical protein
LAWRGFPSGAIDGGFGEHTGAALVRYQRWAGLSADGRAGPATLRSLRLASPRAPVALAFPVAAALGDRFGPRGDRFHSGIDLVAAAGRRYGRPAPARHLRRLEPRRLWQPGRHRPRQRREQLVRASVAHRRHPRDFDDNGNAVGLVGATGNAAGPHLHFEVRLRGAVTDPRAALR